MKGFGRCGHRKQRHCLLDMPKGKDFTVAEFSGTCETRKKLLSMGIFPGQCIRMMCRRRNSPVVVSAGNSNIIISEALAREIYIK